MTASPAEQGAPRYINNSGIAKHFGVHHVTVLGWRKHYPPDHQQIPTPAPAAFVVEASGWEVPLWSSDQVPEWDAWRNAHQAYTQVKRLVSLKSARSTTPTEGTNR